MTFEQAEDLDTGVFRIRSGAGPVEGAPGPYEGGAPGYPPPPPGQPGAPGPTQVDRPAASKLELFRRAIEDGIVPPVTPQV